MSRAISDDEAAIALVHIVRLSGGEVRLQRYLFVETVQGYLNVAEDLETGEFVITYKEG